MPGRNGRKMWTPSKRVGGNTYRGTVMLLILAFLGREIWWIGNIRSASVPNRRVNPHQVKLFLGENLFILKREF
jgi:hypothetical protein